MHLQECYKELNIPQGALPIAEEISETELKNLAINCYSCLKENAHF